MLNPTNCDTAIATVVVSAQPGLTIDKIAGTPTANTAGGTIPYSFVVTNTGNVTVTGLTINDAQLSAAAVCPTTTLAPGATTTCTGSHTITQAEVDAGTVVNTATATGSLPGGGTTVSPPDSTTTTIVQTPAITAVKTATLTTDGGLPGLADPGDVITYNVTVRNSGNVTLSSLVVCGQLRRRYADDVELHADHAGSGRHGHLRELHAHGDRGRSGGGRHAGQRGDGNGDLVDLDPDGHLDQHGRGQRQRRAGGDPHHQDRQLRAT